MTPYMKTIFQQKQKEKNLTKISGSAPLNRPFLFSYFPLLCLPSPAHPVGFSFLAIFNDVTSNKNNNNKVFRWWNVRKVIRPADAEAVFLLILP